MTFLSRALPLLDRGFSVIPLKSHGKSPVGPGATGRTRDRRIVEMWAKQWPDANVGVCADDDITILESDDAPRFIKLLAEQGLTLPATLTGGASENRPHWFFRRTQACGAECITVPGLFEFRNVNQYVVGSGSIHPSGALYRFWHDLPLAEFPDALAGLLNRFSDDYTSHSDGRPGEHIQPGPYARLRHAYLRRLDPEDLLTLDLEISEGERHYTMVSLAGLLHDGERSPEDIADILRQVQAQYFSEGKGDAEIDSIAHYATRGAPCVFEPRDLEPAITHGLRVFDTEEAREKWVHENIDAFAIDWNYFRNRTLPEQEIYLYLNGVPMLREEMLCEIFAYRGIGKSALVAGLVRALVKGVFDDSFLGITSPGGKKVLLVDGELPERLLQSRLNQFVGPTPAGLLRVRSLAQVGGYMKALSDPKQQEEFKAQLAGFGPDVIVFDTKTAIFKHDTNEQQQLLGVNEFLMDLRSKGKTVITVHHAGKNGTQRGRTDNDDITDLILQLNARKDWTPGMGLEFSLRFDKVRYGDRLEGFDARWSESTGWEIIQAPDAEVVNALLQGKSYSAITKEFGIGNSTIAKIKKIAQANGVDFSKKTVDTTK